MASVRASRGGRRSRLKSGQTSTEYFLIICVLVIAVAAAAYVYVPSFQSGTQQLAFDVSTILDTHQIGGIGVGAPGGGINGSGINGSGTNGTGTNAAASGAGTSGGGGSAGVGSSSSGNGPGGSAAPGTYQSNSSSFGGIFSTSQTATGQSAANGGTGGGPGPAKGNVPGALNASSKGDVAQTAAAAPSTLQGQPNCGPALIAALTNQPLNQAFMDKLKQGGYLAAVNQQTKVLGITVSNKTVYNGVMSADQVANYLKNEAGWTVNQQSGGNIQDLKNALANGQTPVVLYDNGSGNGTSGHFGVVKEVKELFGQTYVKVDSSTGTVWLPQNQFEQRWNAMNPPGELITATPPQPDYQWSFASYGFFGHF